jgi:competence protein ComEC
MTAPHHGGNNGSSNCFIRAVNPQYVIFSAGRGHHHPTQAAADRYIANGVPVENLFRTDRGDNEGGLNGFTERLLAAATRPAMMM